MALPAQSARSPVLARIWPGLLVLGAVVAAMAPLLLAEFVAWDDGHTVHQNPNLNPPTWAGLAYHWTHEHGNLYIPVTYSLWHAVATLSHLAGLVNFADNVEPWLFNATNLALHVGSSLLVLSLLRVLGVSRWPALAGALLFGIHPLQVESVGWASGMKDCLFVFLSLCTLRVYVAGVRPGTLDEPPRTWWPAMGLAAVFFSLALLSKPTAVVVPLMLVAIERLHWVRPWRRVLPAVLPFLLLTLPVAYITSRVQTSAAVDNAAWFLRPLVALDALGFYIAKIVWPVDLTVIYGRTPAWILAGDSIRVTWLLVTAVAFAAAVISMRHYRVGLGLLLALVPLLPLLGLRTFDMMEKSLVTDHYMLLPMFGVALAVAALLPARWDWRWVTPAAAVLVVLGVLSFRQSQTWRSTSTLFEHMRQLTVNDFAGRGNLAELYLARGDLQRARQVLEEALAAGGTDEPAVLSLWGRLHVVEGQYDVAAEAYEEALTIRGRHIEDEPGIGGADAAALGQVYDLQAEQAAAEAQRLQGEGDVDAATAAAERERGLRDDARHMFEQAIRLARLDPEDESLGDYLYDYALVLVLLGRNDAAEAALAEAVGPARGTLQEHRRAEAYFRHAFLLNQLGQRAAAQRQLAAALRLAPEEPRYLAAAGGPANRDALLAAFPPEQPPPAAAPAGESVLTLLPITLAGIVLAVAAVRVTRRRPAAVAGEPQVPAPEPATALP